MPPRVLILTASIGEGHDLPARMLAAGLAEERPEVEVAVHDCLPALGLAVTGVVKSAPSTYFFRFEWLWDLGFLLAARFPPTRLLAQRLLELFGRRGLLELIRAADPDVVVSTYPVATEVLGRLRRRGRLELPVCSAITDLAAMHYWAVRGVDLHLLTHPESIAEVREVAGTDAVVRPVHGLTAPAFLQPGEREETRRSLALPATGQIVLVSGGGWGVGDLAGAVEVALELPEVAQVVCLCGRNERAYAELVARFRSDRRVRVEGFTDRMPDWLASADVLVHSTGGLTVLEALMSGCAVISYGWGRGHIRINNEAFERFGLARVARTPEELRAALRRAADERRGPDRSFAELPSAAALVLELADRQAAAR